VVRAVPALAGMVVQCAACASAAPRGELPAAEGAAKGLAQGAARAEPPLARVSFSSHGHHTLVLSDRVAIFDRVAFASPSAIVYDRERDLYWVSNLNGEDGLGHGFISRLEPDAERSTLNYIDAEHGGVALRAPRGLAVFGDVLYVADLKAVHKFKASSGEPLGDITLPSAVFVSDVAVAVDGSLYVADVGSDPNDASVGNAGADAIYQVSPAGQVSVVARRPDLGGPFAVLADATGLWVTCTGTSDLLLVVPSSNGEAVADAGRLRLPGASPRGLVAMPDGTFVVSSEATGIIYRGYRDGPFEPVVSGLESPADMGYDTRRKRLLIPLLTGHSLAIFELSPLPPLAAKRP
jgi:hypothetical protein